MDMKYLEEFRKVARGLEGDIGPLCDWLASLPWKAARPITAEVIRSDLFPLVPPATLREANEAVRRRAIRSALQRTPGTHETPPLPNPADRQMVRATLHAHAQYHRLTVRTTTLPDKAIRYELVTKD